MVESAEYFSYYYKYMKFDKNGSIIYLDYFKNKSIDYMTNILKNMDISYKIYDNESDYKYFVMHNEEIMILVENDIVIESEYTFIQVLKVKRKFFHEQN